MKLPTSITSNFLTRLVRQSQESASLEVTDWRMDRLAGGSTLAGVYRLSGDAHDAGQTSAWSLILKLLPAPSPNHTALLAPTEDPGSNPYWKREYLVYESRLLETLPKGFSAPRVFLVEEREGVCWLWLEDAGDMSVPTWTQADFGIVARHLGLFNGVWLAGREPPSVNWLCNSFVRNALNHHPTEVHLASMLEAMGLNRDVRSLWTDELISRSQALLDDREMFLQVLDQLPRTFLHQDTGRKNLSIRRTSQGEISTLAIDWGFAGIGALGGDLAPLVVASARWFGDVDPQQLPDVQEIAFARYMQGLTEAGWEGKREIVRLGYLLTSILLFGPTWVFLFSDPSDKNRAMLASFFGRPFDEVMVRLSEVNQFVLTQADEARKLIEQTGPQQQTVR